jgi:CheY-like chemotaxis protein
MKSPLNAYDEQKEFRETFSHTANLCRLHHRFTEVGYGSDINTSQEKKTMPPEINPLAIKNSVMVVDSDAASASAIAHWLEEMRYNVVVAHSAGEAIQLLHDISFIGCSLEALLASYHPREATCCRILSEFRYEYPWAAAALMLESDDIAINCWARTRNIPVLYKPLKKEHISQWLLVSDKNRMLSPGATLHIEHIKRPAAAV